MNYLIALICGLLFGFGLIISGMTDPNIVIGFLDIFGNWNYSLAFVMAGAIAVNATAYFFSKNKKPLFAPSASLPTKLEVDKKLVLGAILFGSGWGIAGICPGPGLVNIASLNSSALLFVFSMLAGMLIFKLSSRR